ncbi:MAG: hypothetical protein V3S69_00550 [Dehalococcoidales bacterium]
MEEVENKKKEEPYHHYYREVEERVNYPVNRESFLKIQKLESDIHIAWVGIKRIMRDEKERFENIQ